MEQQELLTWSELTFACLLVIPQFLALPGLQEVEFGLLSVLLQPVSHLEDKLYNILWMLEALPCMQREEKVTTYPNPSLCQIQTS